jgi:hypothetical protein
VSVGIIAYEGLQPVCISLKAPEHGRKYVANELPGGDDSWLYSNTPPSSNTYSSGQAVPLAKLQAM